MRLLFINTQCLQLQLSRYQIGESPCGDHTLFSSHMTCSCRGGSELEVGGATPRPMTRGSECSAMAPFRRERQCSTSVLLYLRLGWIYLLHVIFSGLVLAKLLENTSWNWFIVFVPVFVFDALCGVYWISYLCTYIGLRLNDELDSSTTCTNTLCIPNYDEDYHSECFPRQSISVLVLLLYLVGILLKLVSEVLLCLALNGTISFIAPGSAYSVLFFGVGLSFLYFSLKPTFMLASEANCCNR